MVIYIKLASKLNNWKYTTAQQLLEYLAQDESQYYESMHDGWLSDPSEDWSEPYEHYVDKVERAHLLMTRQGTAHEYKDWNDFWTTHEQTESQLPL